MSIVTQSSCTLLHDQCGDVKGLKQVPTECPYGRQKKHWWWEMLKIQAWNNQTWSIQTVRILCMNKEIHWNRQQVQANCYLHATFSYICSFLECCLNLSTCPAGAYVPFLPPHTHIREHTTSEGSWRDGGTTESPKQTDHEMTGPNHFATHTEQFYQLTVWVLKQFKQRGPENCKVSGIKSHCLGLGPPVRD